MDVTPMLFATKKEKICYLPTVNLYVGPGNCKSNPTVALNWKCQNFLSMIRYHNNKGHNLEYFSGERLPIKKYFSFV